MHNKSRMKTLTSLSSAAFLGMAIAGCGSSAKSVPVATRGSHSDQAAFNPQRTYPDWAYDQPEYTRPIEEPAPEPMARPGDPAHYFVNQKLVMVRQPGGYESEETPRIALWWTNDNGRNWQREGYFGRGQSYFAFEASCDGDYGVRFVGPGQDPAEHTPAYPVRVYHVDTSAPALEVWLEPQQTWYQVGEPVTITWRAVDPHLVESPVRIGLLLDFSSDESRMIELQRDLPDVGSFTFELPGYAFDHEIWFRVEAVDRAGNVGLACTYALQVVDHTLADAGVDSDWLSYIGTEDSASNSSEQLDASESEFGAEWGAADPCDGQDESDVVTMTPEEVSLLWEQAADDYQALLADWARRFTEVSRRAERSAVYDGPPRFGREESAVLPANSAIVIDPCDDESREVTDAERAASTAFALVVDCEEQPNSDFVDGSVASVLSGGEIKGESASAGLPFATAASRGLVDSTGDATPDGAPEATAGAMQPISPADDMTLVEPFTYDRVAGQVMETPLDSFTAYDPTAGNGLFAPLPATTEQSSMRTAHAHPWRALGARRVAPLVSDNIWALPSRRGSFGWQPEFEGRFLADNPTLRNVAEPPSVSSAFAGTPSGDAD
ncbi:MAG: hypothetical protein KF841_16920 [Phycisphaerae bacterium]|nr:hypothetical protein [Phycisphaerae bacterium]